MENLKYIRFKQRFENFEKAYNVLLDTSTYDSSITINKLGIIQAFEITFELSWKTLKDYLESEGYDVNSPRETLKQAFQNNLIDDVTWLKILEDRNFSTHIYDESIINEILNNILTIYLALIKKLYAKLKEKV